MTSTVAERISDHRFFAALTDGQRAALAADGAAGTVLGWSWLHPPYRWHFGAVARVVTTAIEFDAPAVRHRCHADPAFGYAVLHSFTPVIIDRLQATRLRMLDL
jgi:CRP/FNR family cyclic AMP-dependent transcriptional regulator